MPAPPSYRPGGERLTPSVDEALFRALCEGFIEGAGKVLTELEISVLVFV
jgi:hypothetical protein